MASLLSENRNVHGSEISRELGLVSRIHSNPVRDNEGVTRGLQPTKPISAEQCNNLRAARRDNGLDGTTNHNPRRGEDSPILLEKSDQSQPINENDVDNTTYKAGAFAQFNIISDVGYRTEYFSPHTNKSLQVNHIPRTFSPDGLENRPAFEIVTVYDTPATKFDNSTNALLPLSSLNHVHMVIYSPAILKALRLVVEYYPGYDLLGQPVTIPEPYAILLHHRKQLEERRKQFAQPSDQSEFSGCESERESYEHLGLLLDFLRKESYGKIDREEEGYRRATPVANFDMLWLLFKPGTDVYFDLYATNAPPRYNAYVIKRVEGGTTCHRRVPYIIHLWFLDFNGDIIGRGETSCTIHQFEGEKEITSLRVIPVEFMCDRIMGDSLSRQERIQKGKLFFELAKSKLCMDYSGACFDDAASMVRN